MLKIAKSNMIFILICVYFTSKMLWDSLIPVVIEITFLILIIYGALQLILKKYPRKAVSIVIIYALFAVYVLINAFVKDNSQQMGRAIYEYIFYNLFLFALAFYTRKINLEKCAKILHWIGVIIAILSWYEYITQSYIVATLQNNMSYTGNYGFRAAVFTRSYLSHGVILGFFAIVEYYLSIVTGKKKHAYLSIFCVISILTTGSRGPLVATTAALILGYVMNEFRKSNKLDQKIKVWLILLMVVLLGVGFLMSSFTTGNEYVDYFLSRTRNIINWQGDAGNVGRILIWTKAINWFKEDIWFGIGPSWTGSWGAGSIGVTESGILKHLCELGLVGFVIYYSLLINVIIKGMKVYKQISKRDKCDGIFFCCLIALILVNNTTLQSTEEIMVSFVLWLGVGGLFHLYIDQDKYFERIVMEEKQ